jgi:hypothetical protein
MYQHLESRSQAIVARAASCFWWSEPHAYCIPVPRVVIFNKKVKRQSKMDILLITIELQKV